MFKEKNIRAQHPEKKNSCKENIKKKNSCCSKIGEWINFMGNPM